MTVIRTEHPHTCTIKVWHGEDWYDPIPQMVDHLGDPLDLTGKTLELFVRPSFDHSIRLRLLTSIGFAGIRIEDHEMGLAAIFLSQSDVESSLPLSNSRGWRQFLRMSWTDDIHGAVKKIIWTGTIIVLPARDTE